MHSSGRHAITVGLTASWQKYTNDPDRRGPARWSLARSKSAS